MSSARLEHELGPPRNTNSASLPFLVFLLELASLSGSTEYALHGTMSKSAMAISLPTSAGTTQPAGSQGKNRRRAWLVCLALPLVALVGYLVLSLDARAASVLSPVLAIPDRIQSWAPWRRPVSQAGKGIGEDPDGEAEAEETGVPVSNRTSVAPTDSPTAVIESAQATTEVASKMQTKPSSKPRPTASKATGEPALPRCKRTLLYVFAQRHGFASEFNTFIRAQVAARWYNYTLLVDDEHWNYGSLRDYFVVTEPEDLGADEGGCIREPKWRTRRRGSLFTSPDTSPQKKKVASDATAWGVDATEWQAALNDKWATEDHVVFLRGHGRNALDDMMLRLFTDTADVADLHTGDFAEIESIARSVETVQSVPLSPPDTLPLAFAEAYAAQVDHLSRITRFNAQLEGDVASLASRVLPSAIGEGDGPKPVRDLVISVHVRLGDKKGEIKHVSPLRYIPRGWATAHKVNLRGVLFPWQDRSADQTVDVFIRAAQRAKELLISEGLATAGDEAEKATLVVVSDDPHTSAMFRAHPSASQWRMVGTNDMPLIQRRASKRAKPLANGFSEAAWNDLSSDERGRRARAFVRDLGFVARMSDAVVLTPTSNVGRLLAVMVGARFQQALGGQAGVVEARRRIWSADARWFPTGRFF